jgi:cytochrome oxidase Cu insertion factor (SCO1/SenC/PrrC family)
MSIAEVAACAGTATLTAVLFLPIHGASAPPRPKEVAGAAPEAMRQAPDEAVPAPDVPRGGLAWLGQFPNVELTTHQGQKVRFYDDLIRGKVVVINFMYSTCTGS